MSKATYSLKPRRSIKDATARLAKQDGASLVETAAVFFERRAAGHDIANLDTVLERGLGHESEPGDELPMTLRRS